MNGFRLFGYRVFCAALRGDRDLQTGLLHSTSRHWERDLLAVGSGVDGELGRYLNRLSDALWLSARKREADFSSA